MSDEQLAQAGAGVLLLRDEAASLELKVAYDPAWSGLFRVRRIPVCLSVRCCLSLIILN